jgi:PAS domain S-box-containing protein
VKASNNEGTWNETGVALRINISPPFWQTVWFRIIALLAFLSVLYWVYKWRVQARDLAAERRLETALTAERNLLRTLINNLPDYIYIKNTVGHFVVANVAVARQLGFREPAELHGKSDFDLFPRNLAESYFENEMAIMRTGEGIYDFEGPTVDKSKEEENRWITTTKVPLRDAQGNIAGTIGIGRDITERKKAETEREKLIEQLQTAIADIKMLSGLVPICASCKKIRDDQGYWTQIERYIQDRSDARFTHSICPDCRTRLYPEIAINDKPPQT